MFSESVHVTGCLQTHLSYMQNTTWRGLCRKCKVSVMLASQCSHCAQWKKGLCCHQCTKETEATVVTKRAGYLCAAVHHQYHHPCLFVCLFVHAALLLLTVLLHLLAGSAMSGLDGLIGAEERIINSKPKISDNVVRASLSLSFCLCFGAFFLHFLLTCSTRELRVALLKQKTQRKLF